MNDIQTQFLKEVEILFYYQEIGAEDWKMLLRKLNIDLPLVPKLGSLTGYDLDTPRVKLRAVLRSPR